MAVPGQIGSYRIERLLGTGSFATVWLAHDPVLDARVAIKVLADNWSHDLRVRERFVEEGRLLWKLDDERVLRVHAVGELDDGRPYLVTAWADGGSLRDLLDAGPVPEDDARRLLGEIADAVAVLHRHDVVHRDLTPGNVLFRTRADGRRQVLVADLGLAKALAAASGLTARAGTPGYMAPEQDDALALIDARADVFALGVLGGALLGDRATRAERALLARATAPAPADRPVDATAFATALAAAAPAPSAAPAPARPGTWRRPLVLAGVVLVLTAAGVATVVLATRPDTAAARASDRSGRVSVVLPDGWKASGGGWTGQRGAGGANAPGLVVAPRPKHWADTADMPGAFVGVSASLGRTPTEQAVSVRHDGCRAAEPTSRSLGSFTWTVVRHDCGSAARDYVEAAAAVGDAEVVYAQVTETPGSAAPSSDAVLASVSVTP